MRTLSSSTEPCLSEQNELVTLRIPQRVREEWCKASDVLNDTFVGEAANGIGVLQEFVIALLEALEVGPPLGAVLAAMPTQQLSQKPASLLPR